MLYLFSSLPDLTAYAIFTLKKKKPVCFAFNLRKVQLAANQGAA